VTRILLGFYFLWAFVDKVFGLGYSTPAERAWVNGGSPTTGFLTNATAESPLAGLFSALAGVPLVDWLFMLGLLGVGVTLILGVGVRVGAIAGAAMLLFMYLAEFPLTLTGATNPVCKVGPLAQAGEPIVVFDALLSRCALALQRDVEVSRDDQRRPRLRDGAVILQ